MLHSLTRIKHHKTNFHIIQCRKYKYSSTCYDFVVVVVVDFSINTQHVKTKWCLQAAQDSAASFFLASFSFVCSTTYVLLEHTTLCCLFAPAIFRPFVAKAAIFRTLARRRLGDVKRKNHTHIFTKSESNYHTCLAKYCNERPERLVW